MIEFEDLTLREANGNYHKVVELMKEDGAGKTWMLSSKVFVHAEGMTVPFIINFWHDGKIIIDDMLRPASLEIPNYDIAELRKWSEDEGWQMPEPANKILDDPRMFAFWERQFQSGLVACSLLEKRENDLLDKIIEAEKRDQNDELVEEI